MWKSNAHLPNIIRYVHVMKLFFNLFKFWIFQSKWNFILMISTWQRWNMILVDTKMISSWFFIGQLKYKMITISIKDKEYFLFLFNKLLNKNLGMKVLQRIFMNKKQSKHLKKNKFKCTENILITTIKKWMKSMLK